MKILLLEDDRFLNQAINKFLSAEGHTLDLFRDGNEALLSISHDSHDLLILDINVPHLDGLSLLEMIHEKKIQIPTIFISAMLDIEDISRAFELGCHDYLKKPFHLKELTMRIDRILQTPYIPHAHIRLSKQYSYDPASSTLRFQGEVQILSSKQLQIIHLLANNRSRVVSYELLKEHVWDTLDIELPTIRAEINRLKKTLKEDIIINIRNLGYMIERPTSL
ncbi:MAG: DNA-binding response regulator [Sulfurovum sp.]|nr:MAG: DNA-binding response regulator [Sulfurovum sp.]